MKINFHRSSCIHTWLAAGLKPDLFLSINYMIQLPYNSFAIKILQLFLISNKTVLLINSFANQIWDKYQLLDLNQRLFAYQANTLTAELSWYMQDSVFCIEDALPLSYLPSSTRGQDSNPRLSSPLANIIAVWVFLLQITGIEPAKISLEARCNNHYALSAL